MASNQDRDRELEEDIEGLLGSTGAGNHGWQAGVSQRMAGNGSDEALVAQALVDRERFSELVARYQDRIYRLIYRMVGDREDSYDLTQGTFLQAYAGLRGFHPGGRFSPWLYRIAINLSLNYLKQRKTPTVPLDEAAEQIPGLFSEAVDPEELIQRQEVQAAVQRALASLPDKYRAVVLLRYRENLPYEEIANILGLPENTVGTYLFRAKEQLRSKLLESWGDPEKSKG